MAAKTSKVIVELDIDTSKLAADRVLGDRDRHVILEQVLKHASDPFYKEGTIHVLYTQFEPSVKVSYKINYYAEIKEE